MPSNVVHTKKTRALFIEQYKRLGTIGAAAKAVGVDRGVHYDWKAKYPDYAEAFEKASGPVGDLYLDECVNRAIHGWVEPVFSNGKRALDFVMGEDGKLVMEGGKPKAVPASILKKSDACLLALCAARVPGFSQKAAGVSIRAGAAKEDEDDRDIEITVIHKNKPVPSDDEPSE